MIVIIEDPARGYPIDVQHALMGAGKHNVLSLQIGERNVLMARGLDNDVADQITSVCPQARAVILDSPSPLADRSNFTDDTIVRVGPGAIGGSTFAVMAGPCAVESSVQLRECAQTVRDGGAAVLRGGAYKPRTSPHSFQGMGSEGIRLLSEVGEEMGLPVVSEVVDPRAVEYVSEFVDILQIGARNAQNFALLEEVGRSGLPVLLKRGFGCTVEEWLGAAEYVLCAGNPNVILCERGVRTFEPSTRFTLDLAAVAVVKQRTHLPVIVDPSHGSGHRGLVMPLALAAAAVGADGVIIDVHTNAAAAKCDGHQALDGDEFHTLMARLRPVLWAVNRPLTEPTTVEVF